MIRADSADWQQKLDIRLTRFAALGSFFFIINATDKDHTPPRIARNSMALQRKKAKRKVSAGFVRRFNDTAKR